MSTFSASEAAKLGPDLICFGLQKAGTQWLYDQMDSCRQAWMPPVKELNFFAGNIYKPENLRRLAEFRESPDAEKKPDQQAFFSVFGDPRFVRHDVTWYRRLFEPKRQRVSADISPIYATAPEVEIDRIYRTCPNTKYAFLLRHPVDRVWSALCMHARKGKIPERTLRDWKAVSAVVARGNYVRRSYPTRIWRSWANVIPAGSIRFWFLDNIIVDAQRVRHEILTFAGVPNPEFSLGPDFNRKSDNEKVAMSNDVRTGLQGLFKQEVTECIARRSGRNLRDNLDGTFVSRTMPI